MGFVPIDSDPCIYVSTEGETFVNAIHVGDIASLRVISECMAEVKRGLAEGFEVIDMGEPQHYLGVKMIQNPLTEKV